MMALHLERDKPIRVPTETVDKEEYFMQEFSRGEALSKDEDLDGLFIHTASHDR